MSSLSEKIRKRREELGLSQRDLAGQIGISRPSLVRIEQGKQEPRKSVYEKIIKALQVDSSYFGVDEPVSGVQIFPLSIEDRRLLEKWHNLSRDDRKAMLLMLDRLARPVPVSIAEPAHPSNVIPFIKKPLPDGAILHEGEMVPIRVVISAAAGNPIMSDRQAEEEEVPLELVSSIRGKAKLCLVRAIGDSMRDAGISDGALLLCKNVRDSFNYMTGDIVVGQIGESEFFTKRFAGSHKGIIRLLSENPDHPPIERPRKEVLIDAVVLYFKADGLWLPATSKSVKHRP